MKNAKIKLATSLPYSTNRQGQALSMQVRHVIVGQLPPVAKEKAPRVELQENQVAAAKPPTGNRGRLRVAAAQIALRNFDLYGVVVINHLILALHCW
jgi:hypothetical protein